MSDDNVIRPPGWDSKPSTRETEKTAGQDAPSSPEAVPPGWRKEWREPKKRAGASSGKSAPRAPARARVGSGRPTPEQLREEAVDSLRGIHLDTSEAPQARVAAAGKLLEHVDARPGTPDDLTAEEWAEIAEHAASKAREKASA